MSDTLREVRLAMVAKNIAIQAELRDSEALRTLLKAAQDDADAAMEELADLSPADYVPLALSLAKVRTLVYIRRTLRTAMRAGEVAEQALRAEDERDA